MNKLIYIPLLVVLFNVTSCSKDQLDIKNPNEPTLASLNNEEELKKAAMGVYGYTYTATLQEGGLTSWSFLWCALTNHEIMGDALYAGVGNFGWRWLDQVSEITLDNGAKITPPEGSLQKNEIEIFNKRETGEDNPVKHEWYAMYVVNNAANLIINKLDAGTVVIKNQKARKDSIFRAWAYFWKGYAYSRVGSMYNAGIISDTWGATNPNYVSHELIIAEANRCLDKSVGYLTRLKTDSIYTKYLKAFMPLLALYKNNIPSPEIWIHNINALKARNILVNKKRADMGADDWQQVYQLANGGITAKDSFIFTILPDDNVVSYYNVATMTVYGGYSNISERLVQDFKDTAVDQRFKRYITPRIAPIYNYKSRGIQYGTRWNLLDGTDIASTSNTAYVYIAPTYEETALMKAEAAIFMGNIEEGLALIDETRDYQGSGLPHVAGTSLNKDQALEELRSERRIALFLKGVAFYDARRWGIIDPVAQGGGRKNCWVLDASGNLNTAAIFDYNYVNYFPVPANETDFNSPSKNAASVTAK